MLDTVCFAREKVLTHPIAVKTSKPTDHATALSVAGGTSGDHTPRCAPVALATRPCAAMTAMGAMSTMQDAQGFALHRDGGDGGWVLGVVCSALSPSQRQTSAAMATGQRVWPTSRPASRTIDFRDAIAVCWPQIPKRARIDPGAFLGHAQNCSRYGTTLSKSPLRCATLWYDGRYEQPSPPSQKRAV